MKSNGDRTGDVVDDNLKRIRVRNTRLVLYRLLD